MINSYHECASTGGDHIRTGGTHNVYVVCHVDEFLYFTILIDLSRKEGTM